MTAHDVLRSDSTISHYDWIYPVTVDKTQAIKRLQSRFVWLGDVEDPHEHGVVAFTQGRHQCAFSSPSHKSTAELWTNGIGAFVMQDTGIGIELWDMPRRAVWWTQKEPTSAGVTLPVISLEQAQNNPPSASFITSCQGFALCSGRAYWLRVTLTRAEAGYVTVLAELFEGEKLIQMAQMGVIENDWLPFDAPVRCSVARALGNADVMVDVFDYF